jgi:hypothetical protein
VDQPTPDPAYPALESTATPVERSDEPYPPLPPTPVPQSDEYPDPVADEDLILFALDRPILPGDTTISGQGPPGLFILVRNLTFMGETIGTATIDRDGRFEMSVSPLTANIRIGLVGDIEASEYEMDDIRPGPGEFSLPQIGYFFDTVLITEP